MGTVEDGLFDYDLGFGEQQLIPNSQVITSSSQTPRDFPKQTPLNTTPEGLLEAVDSLPTQKKVDEFEAKTAFLLEKASKASAELKEVKEDHKKALDKLNIALTFNQKLETYVGHTRDVVNKARLFDANLAKNPISAGKIISVLVDTAEKMEELLDEM